MNLLNESVSPHERSENMGRLKQLGDQVRMKNEKLFELKSKLCPS